MWNLCNNKGFVVGIDSDNPQRQKIPSMNINQAVEATLSDPGFLKVYITSKPFISFTGPSASENYPDVISVPWTKHVKEILVCHKM